MLKFHDDSNCGIEQNHSFQQQLTAYIIIIHVGSQPDLRGKKLNFNFSGRCWWYKRRFQWIFCL